MASLSIDELIGGGVHFGHKVSRWNPKMEPYIFGKRNLIHIINLVETIRGLARGKAFLAKMASTGRRVVFVGTKRQIKGVVAAEAKRAGMPYINERWLGGTLTNFQTIRSRLKRLEELEKLEADGTMAQYSKKHQSRLLRELRRIKKNLDGVRELESLPGAVLVIDPRKESNAVKEANKLGIPIVAILDTDCDPDDVDIRIPGNDDAMRSVQVLLTHLSDAVLEGKANFSEEAAAAEARADRTAEIKTVRKGQKGKRQQSGPGGPGGRGGDRRGGGGGGGGDRSGGAPSGGAPSGGAAPSESAPAPEAASAEAAAPSPAPVPDSGESAEPKTS